MKVIDTKINLFYAGETVCDLKMCWTPTTALMAFASRMQVSASTDAIFCYNA